jgi:hypothetical protein
MYVSQFSMDVGIIIVHLVIGNHWWLLILLN